MRPKSRREFVRLGISSLSSVVLGETIGAARFDWDGPEKDGREYRTWRSLDRYVDPLPIPARLRPVKTAKSEDRYHIRMIECEHRFHSQLPATTVWGYEGQYPGPTIEAVRGRPVEVTWENGLPLRHLFEVDRRIHGAMPPSPAVRTVPHLHGARSRSDSDGLPERWFTPGSAVHYRYENTQRAATLWYHDHALGITRLNIYAGLSGFYLLRDADEIQMNLPSGEYEIPIILQDRTLNEEGRLVYTPTQEGGLKLPSGTWGPEFFGELPVVNGAVYPFLNVEPRCYRLRVLNSANSRFFNLYLNLAKSAADIPKLIDFCQIGSDGGFLAKPASLRKLLLAPAERADLIVDFSGLAGEIVTLMNDAAAPYPGWNLIRRRYAPLLEIMQFRVSGERTGTGRPPGALQLPALPRLDPDQAAVTRDFVLSESMSKTGQSLGMHINGKAYDDPITEFPKLGAVEKWRFINTTEDSHPMHLHLAQFQILERQGFDYGAFLNGALKLVGKPRQPAANEAGWKDTAIVDPRDVLTILVRFEEHSGKYVYHCHVAEHEDNDMMRPFEVIA